MQGNDAQQISEFIRSVTGSDRYVLDYLLEEVFLKQPEDIQTFLLFTSILNHLSGPLCDALVTAGEMGHPSGSASEAKLEYLERANLFTAPLDNKRQWYCYHPLFADFLRHRLMITQANRVPQLHRRASTWFERQGLIEDALRHALAAQDFEMATRLIEQVADRFWARGQILTMLSWLKLIPDDLLCARARLSLNYAWALILTNQLDSAEPVLQSVQSQVLAASTTPEFDPPTPRVEQTPSANGTAWDRSPQGTLAKVATLRAFVARYKGDVPGAISFSQQALDLIPAGQTLTRGMVMLCLGHAQLMSGNIEAAREALSEAGRLGLAARHVDVYLSAMHYLGQLQVLQGELHQAAAIYRQARQFVVEQGEHDYCGIDRIGLGDVLREWNDLEVASQLVCAGLQVAEAGGDFTFVRDGYIACARLGQARGDLDCALDFIRKAEGIARRSSSNYDMVLTAAWRARLNVMLGNRAAARHWLQTSGLDPGDDLRFLNEFEYLTLARVFLAHNELNQATRLLDRMLSAAECAGRRGRVIEILALQALTWQARDDMERATQRLEQALVLAEPEGYVRTFADEGEQMRCLLQHVYSRGVLPEYVTRLLAAFRGSVTTANTATDKAPSRQIRSSITRPDYSQPKKLLNEREIEILHLIAAGLTNLEIAHELVFAESTVKWHAGHIYRKLGVRNRTQALARAKELGLLDR